MTRTIQEIYKQAIADGHLTDDPAQQVILPFLETMRAQLTPSPGGLRAIFSKGSDPVKGLYLWGGVGRGKSMLVDMFVDAVTAPKRRVHFHAFMQEIHAALHIARKSNVKDALTPLAREISARFQLLALDEMQINDITDAMLVARLFEQLIADGVTLVTTSNRPPEDLYQDGLNRDLFLPFIELLHQHLNIVELASATDHRQGQFIGRQVYFTPHDAAAMVEMNKIWQELAGGDGTELVLRLKNRETVLPMFRNGIARAEFWDLCGKPLGPADFLALADAVRVLILENVPILGRANYNEAKRFVTLIDALYEAKVRLVISAADVPERLYQEGTGAFEFARTASRLREMQSDAWGKM